MNANNIERLIKNLGVTELTTTYNLKDYKMLGELVDSRIRWLQQLKAEVDLVLLELGEEEDDEEFERDFMAGE